MSHWILSWPTPGFRHRTNEKPLDPVRSQCVPPRPRSIWLKRRPTRGGYIFRGSCGTATPALPHLCPALVRAAFRSLPDAKKGRGGGGADTHTDPQTHTHTHFPLPYGTRAFGFLATTSKPHQRVFPPPYSPREKLPGFHTLRDPFGGQIRNPRATLHTRDQKS